MVTSKPAIIHVCGSTPSGYGLFVEMQERVEELEALLRHIQAMCGHPDAGQACRNIIVACEKALEDGDGE